MLLSNTAVVTWNAKNKKHYVDLGYPFTKLKDTFEAKVEHLTRCSRAKVLVKCDYCGKEYECVWQHYYSKKVHSILPTDACKDCCELKAVEAIETKYGSFSEMHFASDEKRKRTNMEKYGCDNPFGNEEIKQKIKNTNLEKYGYECAMQHPDVVKKGQQTCLEKYGVINYGKIYSETHRGELSNNWKGGVSAERDERSNYIYRNWRKEVFARDHYTCQKCGIKCGVGTGSVELNVHHIRNWRDNEDCRYDVDNGIVLCEKCHIQFHSQYGKRHNTPEQLEEFLNNEKIDEKIC